MHSMRVGGIVDEHHAHDRSSMAGRVDDPVDLQLSTYYRQIRHRQLAQCALRTSRPGCSGGNGHAVADICIVTTTTVY